MSLQPSLESKLYYIVSKAGYFGYPLLAGTKRDKDTKLIDIFDEKSKKLIETDQTFDLQGSRLEEARKRLKQILDGYLKKRGTLESNIPPNISYLTLFGEELTLNLRDSIDDKIYSFGFVYNIIDHAYQNSYPLKLVFSRTDLPPTPQVKSILGF